MKIAMAAPVAAFVVFLFGVGMAFGQLEDALTPTEFVESACNLTVYLSVRYSY